VLDYFHEAKRTERRVGGGDKGEATLGIQKKILGVIAKKRHACETGNKRISTGQFKPVGGGHHGQLRKVGRERAKPGKGRGPGFRQGEMQNLWGGACMQRFDQHKRGKAGEE